VKVFAALVMGFFSGFLIYMAVFMLFAQREPSSSLVLITIGGAWFLSTWALLARARSFLNVCRRGFLLGVVEWLAMIPVALLVSGRAFVDTAEQFGGNDAALAGSAVGAGLSSFVGTGMAVGMALVCLLCYGVTFLFKREASRVLDTETKLCPFCAEPVMLAAIKCKHCGSEIGQEHAVE